YPERVFTSGRVLGIRKHGGRTIHYHARGRIKEIHRFSEQCAQHEHAHRFPSCPRRSSLPYRTRCVRRTHRLGGRRAVQACCSAALYPLESFYPTAAGSNDELDEQGMSVLQMACLERSEPLQDFFVCLPGVRLLRLDHEKVVRLASAVNDHIQHNDVPLAFLIS